MSDQERKNRIAALKLAVDALRRHRAPAGLSWTSVDVLMRMIKELEARNV